MKTLYSPGQQKIKTKYEIELQGLKPRDEVQTTTKNAHSGYDFIHTAGHGYLIVPRNNKNIRKALSIRKYGFKGPLAVYLEEDCEAGEFLKVIKHSKTGGGKNENL